MQETYISKKAYYLREKVDAVKELKYIVLNPQSADQGSSAINGLFS